MTGIEVFANLVAAYEGTPAERSRKAFVSLLIIMGTTGVTMLIVGPAIFNLADPSITDVSVFTQTMDKLLPQPLPLIGTLVGVAVLMSASAASAQGLQNLSLGLKERRYIPPTFGRVNQFGVADKPVWLEVAIVSICFLLFGTHEETYLALYAAGVFILLSMTGWAVTKRLFRQIREGFSFSKIGVIVGTIVASILTTAATIIIFEERFMEGAWTYLAVHPTALCCLHLLPQPPGRPHPADGIPRTAGRCPTGRLWFWTDGSLPQRLEWRYDRGCRDPWQPEPIEKSVWRDVRIEIQRIAVLLDGSMYAAQAIPYATAIAKATNAHLVLLSSVKNETPVQIEEFAAVSEQRQTYLDGVSSQLGADGISVSTEVRGGHLADTTRQLVEEEDIDLVVTSTVGKSGNPHWLSGGISSKLMRQVTKPVLLVQTTDEQAITPPKMERIMVSLDGSILAENTLPYARAFGKAFGSEIILLAVPQVPQVKDYRAPDMAVEQIRSQMEATMDNFLGAVARSLREDGVNVRTITKGSLPVRTIVSTAREEDVEMIMLTSQRPRRLRPPDDGICG